MNYLLDTNVISQLAPGRDVQREELVAWLDRASDSIFLSAITAAEIVAGIAKAEREGAHRKAIGLRDWWHAVEHLYADRILPFDLAAAHAAGAILDRARAHDPGFEDIAIAAIAEARKLVVVTLNERHFAPLGVAVLNPRHGFPPAER